MSAAEAARKGVLAQQVLGALAASSQTVGPSVAFWVPGRIEFVGKHTDYAGGRSLVCAVEQGIVIAATPRVDRVVRMHDVVRNDTAHLAPGDATAPRGHWSNYPATVTRRIVRNFSSAVRGANITFASDLPVASGLSSSSALVVATFLALAALNDVEAAPQYRAAIRSCEDLAAYLGTVENGMSFGTLAGEAGVGTFGGSEDHAAILCATPGALTQFSFCPLHTDRVVPLPRDHVFVIASNGVLAEKTGAALDEYNRVSILAREATEWLGRARGRRYQTLAAAIAAGATHRDLAEMPAPLRARTAQFAEESTVIVPAVSDALLRDDLTALGLLVAESQRLAESHLGIQVPETVFLAASARELGAVAASAFGAGFGGSVWALVAENDARRFQAQWRDAYAAAFPKRRASANFFVTRPGPRACRLDIS